MKDKDVQAFDEDLFQTFVAHLMDEDEDSRYAAAHKILDFGAVLLNRAVELTTDPRPRMREIGCFLLGQYDWREKTDPNYMPDPIGVEILMRLLESDPEQAVRAAAAFALGFQASPKALPLLLRLASDSSVEVRYGVTHALGSYYEDFWEKYGAEYRPAVQTAFLRLMDDEDEDVRDWATFGIHQGDYDTPEVRARLWKSLEDTDSDVRGEAAEGLAKFGDRSFIPRLEKLLREDEDAPTHYFEAAEVFGDPVLLPAVLEAAQSWRDSLEEGEELPHPILSAIEALQKAATAGSPSNEID